MGCFQSSDRGRWSKVEVVGNGERWKFAGSDWPIGGATMAATGLGVRFIVIRPLNRKWN